MRIPARTLVALVACIVVAAVAAGAIYAATRHGRATGPANPGQAAHVARPPSPAPTASRAANATLTVGPAIVGRSIPSGFVGLTTEYRGLESYAGANPAALDPVFEQLLRNLAPGQGPVLRLGGDSTDWTWWPVPHMARPGGVKYDLDGNWLKVAAALAKSVDARLILGINFEADSTRVAAAEAHAFIGGLGASRIAGLELGNEPELYAAFPWYKLPNGQHVRGRPASYGFGAFVPDFAHISRALPRQATLAGPATGAATWIPQLGRFLAANPHVGLVTLHKYPLKHCSASTRVTVPEVLSSSASTGLAASVARATATAHAHHARIRIDEMSAISCGGVLGVSNSFATALWSLDTLFAMARVGVDGVNVQTAPRSWNELFAISHTAAGWQAAVNPAYYGMVMFAQAAPAGARLLHVTGSPGGGIQAWATRATDGAIRVVLINDALSGTRTISLRVPGASAAGTLERLQAPSARATGGVTLGGQSFGAQTTTGQLAGTPALTSVAPASGHYAISLPAASAAMLTIGS